MWFNKIFFETWNYLEESLPLFFNGNIIIFGGSLIISPSLLLRIAYCIVIISSIYLYVTIAGSMFYYWNPASWKNLPSTLPLFLIPVLGIYRIYMVICVKGTLDVFKVSGKAEKFYKTGVFLLYSAFVVCVLTVLLLPIMLLLRLLFVYGGLGLSVFLGSIVLWLQPSVKVGLLVFEMSRIIIFEKKTRDWRLAEAKRLSKPNKTGSSSLLQ